ncbi:MAG: hypothetical protein U0232_13745 [Thermomicrobiales bacterium]
MTSVEIRGEDFWIDGRPTYAGRSWRGQRIEGLLFNSRMVQAAFDDENPETRGRWAYPDTGEWDPERNLAEFLAMLPEYRRHGLLAVTVNLQGGSPEGYSQEQPWDNGAFEADGSLRPAHLDRLRRILDRLDELGMVAIIGLFYFGQDERLRDEAAVVRGVENAVGWLLEGGWRNVILEVNNESDVPLYQHEILQPQRVHELIALAKGIEREGRRLLVGTSFVGVPYFRPTQDGEGVLPDAVAAISDYLLLHGNAAHDPAQIEGLIRGARALPSYRPMPVVFNEDDHFAFDQPRNNMLVATEHRASWGYFDPGPGTMSGGARSDYREGYQLVPVNWGINTERKRGFFRLLGEITGATE